MHIKKKISLGFVVFHPENKFWIRIQDLLIQGYEIYLFDNSPDYTTNLKIYEENKNFKYLTCGKNVGLSIGLTTICYNSWSKGNEVLLFFDQDTIFSTESIISINNFFNENRNKFEVYSAIQFESRELSMSTNFNLVKNVNLIINSGSLFNLNNAKSMDWFNMNYFIDCIDYDYCLRSSNHNFLIGKFSYVPDIDHQSDQADKDYIIFNKKIRTRKYSIFRIKQTVSSSLRILYDSLINQNIKYSILILKSLFIYLLFQSFAYLFPIFLKKIPSENVQ